MSRILFTFAGGSGHADPLVPIASAAEAAGHTVSFFGRRSAAAMPEARGFPLFADPDEAPGDPTSIAPMLPIDMGREDRALRDGFADRIARARSARVMDLSAEWRPDLVVCDETDFGSMIAAERLRFPHATVLVNASGSFVRPGVVAGPLAALRAEQGLRPDPDLAMLRRDLVLSPFPPSFRDPAHPLPPNALAYRWAPAEAVDAGPSAPWLARMPDRPTVYVTLGTVFNMESGDLFPRVLSALGGLPINVVVTVGRQIDPDAFGLQPDNVRVERYIAQSALLPACDLVVNHGGSGSVIGALAHGLPMVLIPMGADQPLNAERCRRLGVGVVLDAVRVSARSIRDAAIAVLDDVDHRAAAERLRDEIAALPEPAAAVPCLEALVPSA